MLAEKQKQEIEKFAQDMSENHPFFLKAERGEIGKKQMESYLYNLHYLFINTTRHLKLAREICLERGDQELADFFQKKYDEEFGHEKWAKEDLENAGAETTKEQLEESVSPIVIDLMSMVERAIEKEPRLHFGYMGLAEYLTVLMAPKFLNDLESRCDIKKTNVSAITNHEELDRHHAEEDFELTDYFAGGRVDEEEFLGVQRKAMKILEKFWSEISELNH